MKISELMTTKITTCGPRSNLAEIAALLWKHDCGFLPVVDDQQHLIGILTDRDVCIALGTRNQRASDVTVEQAMSKNIYSCSPEDDVKSALSLMQSHMVWRLPVVAADKTVRGILTVGSIVKHASPTGDISHALVMTTLEKLSAPQRCETSSPNATAEPVAQSAKSFPIRAR